MSDFWVSERLQLAAWGLSLLMLALVLLILVGLLGLRLYRRWQAPQREAMQQAHRLWLIQAAMGEPWDLHNGQRWVNDERSRWAFLKLWLHMQLSLKGVAHERLTLLGQSLDLAGVALQQLNSPHYAKRMVALLTLGVLRHASAVPVLQERLAHGHAHSTIYAGRALLEVDASAHAQAVVRGVLDKDELDWSLLAVLFKPFRPALQQAMLDQWPRIDPSERVRTSAEQLGPMLRCLRLARALQLQLPSPLLAPLLHPEEDIESLIAAIRLFQGEQGIEPLLRLADHPEWRVRAQVARALSYVGQASCLGRLVTLTTDREWWVRFRAAQALFRLPGVSCAELLQQVHATQDRYAIQMVQAVACAEGRV